MILFAIHVQFINKYIHDMMFLQCIHNMAHERIKQLLVLIDSDKSQSLYLNKKYSNQDYGAVNQYSSQFQNDYSVSGNFFVTIFLQKIQTLTRNY